MKNGRCAIYRAERKKGRTYQDIADEYGVSRQMVAQACAPFQTLRFRVIQADDCVYVNIREWLNKNRISKKTLVFALDLEPCTNNYHTINAVLRGKSDPRKSLIDKLMKVTGFSYEQLFEMDGEKNDQ